MIKRVRSDFHVPKIQDAMLHDRRPALRCKVKTYQEEKTWLMQQRFQAEISTTKQDGYAFNRTQSVAVARSVAYQGNFCNP